MSACNACRVRYCFTSSVHPSVHPMPVLCLNKRTYHHTFLTIWQGRSSLLSPTAVAKFQGETPQWGGVLGWKSLQILPFILKMVWDRPIFTMEHFNRKSWVADQSMSVPAILSDLERCDVMGQNFLADLHNYAPTVWPRRRNLAW